MWLRFGVVIFAKLNVSTEFNCCLSILLKVHLDNFLEMIIRGGIVGS